MKRISFFVHDLENNPIVRAAPLAQALAGQFDVEILGFLHHDREVYEPYRGLFEYRTLRVPLDVTRMIPALPRLAAMATGDIVYACKPLVPTLGPALLASSFGRRRPLLLDVEDDERVPMGTSPSAVIWRDVLKGWRHATAWKFTLAVHGFVPCAEAVTVSTSRLQARYGGTIVRHGPDEHVFDPASAPPKADARRAFNLPQDVPLAIFAGMPQPHKGFAVLRDALADPRCASWHLALAGPEGHPEFVACQARLGARCHYLGVVPQSRMPVLLAAADVAPVPQLAVRFAMSQLPAKALEAMAMGCPPVASRVSDLPDMLGHGARGWLVEPGDADGLAFALADAAARPDERERRGRDARVWFLANASRGAMTSTLVPLVTGAAEEWARRRRQRRF
ncbi:MAG: glycosyltransferase family 4 protein [Vicinamibacterales bacterium]